MTLGPKSCRPAAAELPLTARNLSFCQGTADLHLKSSTAFHQKAVLQGVGVPAACGRAAATHCLEPQGSTAHLGTQAPGIGKKIDL